MKSYNALIIGFGKGGKTLAGFLASTGASVAVVEVNPAMYGGTCINVGCIPSKSMVYSSHDRALKGAGRSELAERFAKAVEEKNTLIGMLRNKNYHMIADKPEVDVIDGEASFTGPDTVAIRKPDGSVEEVRAEKIFINTGSRPVMPAIPGLKDARHAYVSETLLDLDVLPEHLVVIGGGYIGLEFASLFRRFGSKVTVLQRGPVFLPKEDADMSAEIAKVMKDQGIVVKTGVTFEKVVPGEAADRVVIRTAEGGEELLDADAILVATGRKPNIAPLHLEKAGVETTERGAVKVDEYCCTNVPNIWAMGDVTGHEQFTYMSLDDFRIVRDQLTGRKGRSTKNRGHIAYSVFIDPSFARVGMTEEQAREAGHNIKVGKLACAGIPKARILRNPNGLLKAIVDADTDQILGVHLFCEEAFEMINLVKVAMDAKLPYTVLRDAVYTHPTMTEAFNDLFKI